MANKLSITLKKSTIGRKPKHKATIESLGLKRINDTIEKEATPDILGKVKKVSYLLDVKEV